MSVTSTEVLLGDADRFDSLGGDGISSPLGIALYSIGLPGDASGGTASIRINCSGYTYVVLNASAGLSNGSIAPIRLSLLDPTTLSHWIETKQSPAALTAAINNPVNFEPRMVVLPSGSIVDVITDNPGVGVNLNLSCRLATFRNDSSSLGILGAVSQFLV